MDPLTSTPKALARTSRAPRHPAASPPRHRGSWRIRRLWAARSARADAETQARAGAAPHPSPIDDQGHATRGAPTPHTEHRADPRRPTSGATTEPAPGSTAAHPVPCPHCGATQGFLIHADGMALRVLEDDHDVDLLAEADPEDLERVACLSCNRLLSVGTGLQRLLKAAREAVDAGRATSDPSRPGRKPRRRDAGPAAWRNRTDGRRLPMCPSCGAKHDFFIDLDGAVYRVLEDDNDTDLLDESTSEGDGLLCASCDAIFRI